MPIVEFHCHTRYSKDSLTDIEALLAECKRKHIDKVVITDHNTIAGALQANMQEPQRVIVGEEILTAQGELLAAFVHEEVPPGLPAVEAIRLLRQQGAFISVSHPFDRLRREHWSEADLLEILPLVDAIETFNSRSLWLTANRRAQAFARQHRLLRTIGSDAHTLSELGTATMRLPDFDDTASLRSALTHASHHARYALPWVHFSSRYAAWQKNRLPQITQ